jgi:hypothetical protein
MNADEVVKGLQYLSGVLRAQAWHKSRERNKELATTCSEAAALIESLQAQLADAQRLAEAAIKDMRYYIGRVLSPKYGNYACCICKHVDKDCGMLIGCNGLNHWAWRGE